MIVRGKGSTEEARISAPIGRVAPPVIATTPLSPKMTPGVEKPWSASRLAIATKAVLTTIVRMSPRRAPTTVSPAAAIQARSALKPTE